MFKPIMTAYLVAAVAGDDDDKVLFTVCKSIINAAQTQISAC